MRLIKPISLAFLDKRVGSSGFQSVGQLDAFLEEMEKKQDNIKKRIDKFLSVEVATVKSVHLAAGGYEVQFDIEGAPIDSKHGEGKAPALSKPFKKPSAADKKKLEENIDILGDSIKEKRHLEAAYAWFKTANIGLSPKQYKERDGKYKDILKVAKGHIESIKERFALFFDGKVPKEFKKFVSGYMAKLSEEFYFGAKTESKLLSFWKIGDDEGIDFHYYIQMNWLGTESRVSDAVIVLTHRIDYKKGAIKKIGLRVSSEWIQPQDLEVTRHSAPMSVGGAIEMTKTQFIRSIDNAEDAIKEELDLNPREFKALPDVAKFASAVKLNDSDLIITVKREIAGKTGISASVLDKVFNAVRTFAQARFPEYSVLALPPTKKSPRNLRFVFKFKQGHENELDMLRQIMQSFDFDPGSDEYKRHMKWYRNMIANDGGKVAPGRTTQKTIKQQRRRKDDESQPESKPTTSRPEPKSKPKPKPKPVSKPRTTKPITVKPKPKPRTTKPKPKPAAKKPHKIDFHNILK